MHVIFRLTLKVWEIPNYSSQETFGWQVWLLSSLWNLVRHQHQDSTLSCLWTKEGSLWVLRRIGVEQILPPPQVPSIQVSIAALNSRTTTFNCVVTWGPVGLTGSFAGDSLSYGHLWYTVLSSYDHWHFWCKLYVFWMHVPPTPPDLWPNASCSWREHHSWRLQDLSNPHLAKKDYPVKLNWRGIPWFHARMIIDCDEVKRNSACSKPNNAVRAACPSWSFVPLCGQQSTTSEPPLISWFALPWTWPHLSHPQLPLWLPASYSATTVQLNSICVAWSHAGPFVDMQVVSWTQMRRKGRWME